MPVVAVAVLCCAVLFFAVQLQGYLSQPRTISSQHFGTGLLKGEVLPANSRLVSNQGGPERECPLGQTLAGSSSARLAGCDRLA